MVSSCEVGFNKKHYMHIIVYFLLGHQFGSSTCCLANISPPCFHSKRSLVRSSILMLMVKYMLHGLQTNLLDSMYMLMVEFYLLFNGLSTLLNKWNFGSELDSTFQTSNNSCHIVTSLGCLVRLGSGCLRSLFPL